MKITRRSPLSGRVHTMDVPVTEHHLRLYNAGTLAQDAFRHLTPEQREFIISGITPEEWDAMVAAAEDPPDGQGSLMDPDGGER